MSYISNTNVMKNASGKFSNTPTTINKFYTLIRHFKAGVSYSNNPVYINYNTNTSFYRGFILCCSLLALAAGERTYHGYTVS